MRRCRICDGFVQDEETAWVDNPRLGRFWLCPTHRDGACLTESSSGAILYGCKHLPGWLSLGPYPYEKSMFRSAG